LHHLISGPDGAGADFVRSLAGNEIRHFFHDTDIGAFSKKL
jgi:hypothetical protein